MISIYGDAYTNISSVNYNPNWGQSGTVNTDYDPGTGDLVMAYTNFNYQGTGFEANPQNASAMEFVHIDIWTSTATVVNFSPIDNSGMGPSEVLVSVPLVSGDWSSVDLPKSAFTGMSWNSVIQLKFDGQQGVTPSDIYLDNIYFWKNPVAQGMDATLCDLQVDGATVPGFVSSANNYQYGVPGGGAIPQITLATTNDPAASVTSITQATEIPGDATVLVTAANGTTMLTYTVSFFYNSPAEGAPVPTNMNVISLFSDAYTDVNVDTWNTSWSQATYKEDTIAGNPTKKYTNVGFNGIETQAEPINASGMTYLHMDIWTPNMTTFNMKLVSFLGDGFGGPNGDSEANLDFTPTLGEWNQLHIPLADFTNAGLTSLDDLNQYIFTSTPFGSGILFLDNVYFTTEMAVDVDDIENAGDRVLIYPNPATAGASVFVSTEVRNVTVYNLSGQLIMTANTPNVQLQNLEAGIYIVKVLDAKGKLHTEKLIVE
ncbi:MAG: T9SS type A sorting domain-containing protein [Saprospiraceae bacterium]